MLIIFKIPKKHRGPHKTPSLDTCGPCVWDPCSTTSLLLCGWSLNLFFSHF